MSPVPGAAQEATLTISPITNPQIGSTLPANASSQFQQTLQPVADLLHMSTSTLTSELQSGKSLADIAQQQGVSRDQLVSTVEQSLSSNAPAGTDPSKIAAVANQIVDHTPKAGGHHHHHHGGGGAPSATTDPSQTDPLMNPLTNGTSGLDLLA